MIRFALALVLLCASLACSDAAGPGAGEVQIRIGNDSESSFSNVVAIFPEDEVDYGPVVAGGASGYRTVSVAYPYARIDVRIGSTELRIQPRDFVGETTLSPGRYTYSLYFIDGQLQLELKRND